MQHFLGYVSEKRETFAAFSHFCKLFRCSPFCDNTTDIFQLTFVIELRSKQRAVIDFALRKDSHKCSQEFTGSL